MKSLAIIIPVKRPELGKSRLAAALLPHDRLALNRALLKHTFDEAAGLSDIAAIYVVTKSPDVRTEAARRGFLTCDEPEACDLNDAIAIGATHARKDGMLEIMVLPVDLPRLSARRLRSLVAQFRSSLDVVIVTDRAGRGTNVLLWRPVGSAIFQYGTASAECHARSARGLGLRLAISQDAALSFDIDTPQDLQHWLHDGRLSIGAGDGLAFPPGLDVHGGAATQDQEQRI
jgi:2-phospho-L-lactate guanylyltransferase